MFRKMSKFSRKIFMTEIQSFSKYKHQFPFNPILIYYKRKAAFMQ